MMEKRNHEAHRATSRGKEVDTRPSLGTRVQFSEVVEFQFSRQREIIVKIICDIETHPNFVITTSKVGAKVPT